MTEFEVYRGPGDRLVAISTVPVRGAWFVRSGVQGKRMKVSTFPTDEYPSRDGVLASVLTDRYVSEYTGRISPHGEMVSVSDSAVLFWTAQGVDVVAFAEGLVSLHDACAEAGIDVSFAADASGTYFLTDRCRFGTTTARVQPGSVSVVNGKGSGEISLQHDPLLAAFAVHFSRQSLADVFQLACDAEDDLSTDGLFDRIIRWLRPEEASLLESLGMRSFAMSLRSRGKARINF